MKKRNILTLLVCSLFFFTVLTLVFANINGLDLINDDNNKIEARLDVDPDANSPADITTTTAGTETINWILYRQGGSTGH